MPLSYSPCKDGDVLAGDFSGLFHKLDQKRIRINYNRSQFNPLGGYLFNVDPREYFIERPFVKQISKYTSLNSRSSDQSVLLSKQ